MTRTERFQSTADQIRDRWTVSFPKTDVCVVGAEAGGATWEGKVQRVRRYTRKALGGTVVELTLDGLSMSDRPGASYDSIRVAFLGEETITVVSA